MNNINLTQRQLDLIKKNQAILSKLPVEAYAKAANTMNNSYVMNALEIQSTVNNVMNSIRINQSKLSNWASYMHQVTKNHPMFKSNLFSDEVLNSFIKSTSIPKNDILKMSYALRNLNVDVANSSTFIKSINPAHPVEQKQHESNNYSGKKIVDIMHINHSSLGFINASSVGVSGNAIWDFLLKFINNEPINTPFYISVLFIAYFCYLLTSFSNSNDD
ncbi:hypothetical protein [Staphylococcus aureus]|uniref:hypothetical protein n=1 Tax=Staphylococcus aureus TaxID=1280 RepID=UPI0001E0DADC|nr:hypothetical protein [Staphylococcus aureus]AXJ59369.1 hypothetical protein CGP98_01941 [Staphylococcus aureus]AXJ81363.1 hypothetical protein CGP99_01941 [Staphylococcus aureus]AXJ84100.1 hypothetical protein CGQ00_02035 [Staphylococcus aureus]EFM05522.1 hypothetical protein HMPREF0783_2832 [Staphylococcus aureus subsp. aureus ATCC BAA-39]MDT1917991.1 hypothetical protein [Staphylococcus aureus]